MHVGYKKILAAIIVEVKQYESHTPEWIFREHFFGPLDESFATGVLKVMRVAHHVQKKYVGEAVFVQVSESRISAPAIGMQPNLRSYILKPIVPHVFVKNGILVAVRIHVSKKRIGEPYILTVRSLLIGGVL